MRYPLTVLPPSPPAIPAACQLRQSIPPASPAGHRPHPPIPGSPEPGPIALPCPAFSPVHLRRLSSPFGGGLPCRLVNGGAPTDPSSSRSACWPRMSRARPVGGWVGWAVGDLIGLGYSPRPEQGSRALEQALRSTPWPHPSGQGTFPTPTSQLNLPLLPVPVTCLVDPYPQWRVSERKGSEW